MSESNPSSKRLMFLEARLATIRNIAEGELTARAQQEIARLAQEALSEPTSTVETSPQAPIARISVHGLNGTTVSLYAPGLPPGDHDVYLDPSAPGIPGNPAVSQPFPYPTDRDGWICSVCHGWNVPKDRVCMHSHLPSAQKAKLPQDPDILNRLQTWLRCQRRVYEASTPDGRVEALLNGIAEILSIYDSGENGRPDVG